MSIWLRIHGTAVRQTPTRYRIKSSALKGHSSALRVPAALRQNPPPEIQVHSSSLHAVSGSLPSGRRSPRGSLIKAIAPPGREPPAGGGRVLRLKPDPTTRKSAF